LIWCPWNSESSRYCQEPCLVVTSESDEWTDDDVALYPLSAAEHYARKCTDYVGENSSRTSSPSMSMILTAIMTLGFGSSISYLPLTKSSFFSGTSE